MKLAPFYRLHRRSYSIYFDLLAPKEWEEKKAEYAAEQERLQRLEKATVAYVQAGEMQQERDFNFQGPEDARIVHIMGRAGRWSRSWFSFDLPVEPDRPLALVVTYSTGERRRGGAKFEIMIDGHTVGRQEVVRSYPTRFFDVVYPIDADIVKGKEKVTVRFEASEGSSVSAVYGIRMIRADEILIPAPAAEPDASETRVDDVAVNRAKGVAQADRE